MKARWVLCCVSLAILSAPGCESRSPESEPRPYDAEYDGPPQTVEVSYDHRLLADQRNISDDAGAAARAWPVRRAKPKPDADANEPETPSATTETQPKGDTEPTTKPATTDAQPKADTEPTTTSKTEPKTDKEPEKKGAAVEGPAKSGDKDAGEPADAKKGAGAESQPE